MSGKKSEKDFNEDQFNDDGSQTPRKLDSRRKEERGQKLVVRTIALGSESFGRTSEGYVLQLTRCKLSEGRQYGKILEGSK